MLHLTMATHYCCGNLIASKISLTGVLASCGMENCMDKDYLPTEKGFITHCCEDVVTFYVTDSNYTPSFSVVPDFSRYNLRVFNISVGLPVPPNSGLTSLYTNASPPDALMSTSVDLTYICVFRIWIYLFHVCYFQMSYNPHLQYLLYFKLFLRIY